VISGKKAVELAKSQNTAAEMASTLLRTAVASPKCHVSFSSKITLVQKPIHFDFKSVATRMNQPQNFSFTLMLFLSHFEADISLKSDRKSSRF
jgi:hypothetical protein